MRPLTEGQADAVKVKHVGAHFYTFGLYSNTSTDTTH